MTIFKEEKPVGVVVGRDEARSGEVNVFSRKLEPKDAWVRIIPHGRNMSEIEWISCLPHNFDKYAPKDGDGILIKKQLLLESKLLTRRQIFEIETGLV